MVHDNLLVMLVLGAYAFSAGGYIFAWKCYLELRDNHYHTLIEAAVALEERIKDAAALLETRISHLERNNLHE